LVGVGDAAADGVGLPIGVDSAELVGVETGDEATGAFRVGVLTGSGCWVKEPTLGSVPVLAGPGGVMGRSLLGESVPGMSEAGSNGSVTSPRPPRSR
jgi:hypothetical protein